MPKIKKLRFIKSNQVSYFAAFTAWNLRDKDSASLKEIELLLGHSLATYSDFEALYRAYEKAFSPRSNVEPVKIDSSRWVFNNILYQIQGTFDDDQSRLLVLEEFDKERRLFEKLKTKFDEEASSDIASKRPRIPEQVRVEIWRRDGGKCARCGSREKLEYDHIVPISKGGSNTARNIELLCEKHNRSKSDNVV